MISRSGYLCFLSHWLFLTCFPLIWADWASHVPSRRWYWTGRNRGWLKICSLQFLQQLWTILFQIKSGCWQANWQMQSHSPSARTHQQYMCHLWSICRKDDMPIALGQLGRMQQHRKVCPWAFLLLLLPTWERFGNLMRQCFKTAVAKQTRAKKRNGSTPHTLRKQQTSSWWSWRLVRLEEDGSTRVQMQSQRTRGTQELVLFSNESAQEWKTDSSGLFQA